MPLHRVYVALDGELALKIIDQLPISRLEFWQACGYRATTDKHAGALLFHLKKNRLPKPVFDQLIACVPVHQREEALRRLCEGQEGASGSRLGETYRRYREPL